MWIVPSRRDHLIERVFSLAPPTMPGIVVVDRDDVGKYEAKRIPANWRLHVVDGCVYYRDKINAAFAAYPHEPFYGMVADDMVPVTPGWDVALGERAGQRSIAGSSQVFINNRHIGGGALGGDLVRACGWLCCPRVKHFYSDDVFELIGAEFSCFTVHRDIEIEHRHFSTGLAPYDNFYRTRSDGEDRTNFEKWKIEEWPALKEKLAPLYA